ncbi:MAG: hypothetical protein WCK31_04720 [bacterium]
MKNILEWIVVLIMVFVGGWMVGILLWAIVVATYEFIYYFLYTLGAMFIYLGSIFLVGIFILIKFAEEPLKVNGK